MRLFVLALAAVAAAAPHSVVPLALRFEPNVGQTDQRVQFVARSLRCAIFLTQDGAVLALGRSREGVGIRFVNSNPTKFDGGGPLPGLVNYFHGSGPGLANIPTYERVRQRDVYPGIDAVFHGEDGQIEYDFVVAPGADPSRIVLAFDGARGVRINDNGEIELATADGILTQRKTVLYQERNGQRIPVAGHYEAHGNGQFTLAIAPYDHTRTLIIDPTLVFSVSIAGSGPNQVNGVALDSQGNIYIAGQTGSLDFPVIGGVQGQLSVAYAYRLSHNGTDLARLNGVLNSVTSIAADPRAPYTVYAATLNGLLRSTDAGGTWNTIGAGLPSGATITSIVIRSVEFKGDLRCRGEWTRLVQVHRRRLQLESDQPRTYRHLRNLH